MEGAAIFAQTGGDLDVDRKQQRIKSRGDT